jgi:hypothetical protein
MRHRGRSRSSVAWWRIVPLGATLNSGASIKRTSLKWTAAPIFTWTGCYVGAHVGRCDAMCDVNHVSLAIC